ncbi:MAG: hypothetical protein WBX22_08630, partial [Silvibacterium sp.]
SPANRTLLDFGVTEGSPTTHSKDRKQGALVGYFAGWTKGRPVRRERLNRLTDPAPSRVRGVRDVATKMNWG